MNTKPKSDTKSRLEGLLRRSDAEAPGNHRNGTKPTSHHYGPDPMPVAERQRLHDELDGEGLADLLGRLWEGAPAGVPAHVYVQLVGGCLQHNMHHDNPVTDTSTIGAFVPDAALEKLTNLTKVPDVREILVIGQHKTYSTAEEDWDSRGTEAVLGPVAERLLDHDVDTVHPTDLADATSNLMSTGDLTKTTQLFNNAPSRDQDRPGTRPGGKGHPEGDADPGDAEHGPGANDPNITLQGWASVKEVKSVAQRRYNVISVAFGGWYSAYTRPKHRPHSAATKARVDLMPDEEIETLLGREPDGSVVKYLDVPDSLYDRIVDWRPQLEDYKPLTAIFQKNLLDYHRDEDFDAEQSCTGIPIPHTFVFAAFGITPQVGWNRGLNAAVLLEIYRRRVDEGFTWSGWSHEDGKARIITEHGIPDGIIALAKHTRFSPDMEDSWTYLINGNDAGNRHFTSDLREKRRNELDEGEDPAIEPPEVAKEMQEYLNGLDQQFFGNGNYGKLRPEQLAKASEAASAFRKEQRRDQANRKLVGMRTHPQPLYDFCDRFPRQKADPYNQAMNLPAELRHPLYGDRDYEVDLDKAHLACYIPVVRREGIEVPTLEKYIAANLRDDEDLLERGDLWWDLASRVDKDVFGDRGALRTAVKRAYSAVYGSTTQTMLFRIYELYADLTGEWPEEGTGPLKAILDHPLMEELLETRDKLEAIITNRGGLEDATGRFIPLSAWDGVKKKENRWRGVMAYVNCSFEQEIMYPIFKEAKKEMERDEYPRFRVWLYQGDGVTINIDRRVRNHEKVIARLQAAVSEKADELGVPTKLTVDWPA